MVKIYFLGIHFSKWAGTGSTQAALLLQPDLSGRDSEQLCLPLGGAASSSPGIVKSTYHSGHFLSISVEIVVFVRQRSIF